MKTFSVCPIHGDYDDHVHPMCPACRDLMERHPFKAPEDESIRPMTVYSDPYALEGKMRAFFREHGDRAGGYINDETRRALDKMLAPRDNPNAFRGVRYDALNFRWGTLDIRSCEAISPGWMLLVGRDGHADAIKIEEEGAS